MNSKALTATLACLVVLAVGGGAAQAVSTIQISPAGEITGASVGPLTFTTDSVSVTCQLTFAGALVESSTGASTGTIVPEVNPNIGTVTEASLSECEGGATLELLTEDLPWPLVITGPHSRGVEWISMYPARLHFTNALLGIDCVYTKGISFWGATTSEMTVEIPPLEGNHASGECDTGTLEMTGSITLSPEQTIVRRR